MHKTCTALLVAMLFSSLGLWGCTHQKNGANHTKIRELENRYAKLEEDYRVIQAVNDATRKKLDVLETQRNELAQKVEELQGVVKERDELQEKLASRTQERDAVQAQFRQFSKELQSLASRIETAAAAPFGNALTVLPASRKAH